MRILRVELFVSTGTQFRRCRGVRLIRPTVRDMRDHSQVARTPHRHLGYKHPGVCCTVLRLLFQVGFAEVQTRGA